MLSGTVVVVAGTCLVGGGLLSCGQEPPPPLRIPPELSSWLDSRPLPEDALDELGLDPAQERELVEELVALWESDRDGPEFDAVLLRQVEEDAQAGRMLEVGKWRLTRTMVGFLIVSGLHRRGELPSG